MFSINNLLIGLALIGLGVAGVKYTFWLTNTLGAQDWIERFTGPGTTYGILKLLSVAVAIIGFFIATGLGTPVMDFVFSPLKSVFNVND